MADAPGSTFLPCRWVGMQVVEQVAALCPDRVVTRDPLAAFRPIASRSRHSRHAIFLNSSSRLHYAVVGNLISGNLTFSTRNGWHVEHDTVVTSDAAPEESPVEETEIENVVDSRICRSIRVEIPASTLLTPRAYFEPFDDDIPVMTEPQALAALARVQRRQEESESEFIAYDLDDFAVYRDSETYPCEMRSLHFLDRPGTHYFCGVLSLKGEHRVLVKHVPIAALPVDNYEDCSKHTAGHAGQGFMRDHGRRVSIDLFRSTFSAWLVKTHKKAPVFVEWLEQYPRTDFRTAVVANIAYLHKEAIGVLGERSSYSHPIWSEIWQCSRYKRQPAAADPRTVVTQYIFDCFDKTLFADQLVVVPISARTERLRNSLIRERHLELPSALDASVMSLSTAVQEQIKGIKPGDTISTHRDGELSGSKWKREVSRDFNDVDRWLALVQKAHIGKGGMRVFDVIWYYRPVDTLCGLMKYPWNNELFLSDHCSCENETCKIREDEVLGVHKVDFGGTSTTTAEFFCRQTYIHEERKWISLGPQHMRCEHVRERSWASPYQAGDTLLVLMNARDSISEPCEVVTVVMQETRTSYQLRKLLRRRRVDPQAVTARPNELVYTDSLFDSREESIVGRCHVRVFPAGSDIPTPYDRDGVGAYFYMTHREVVGDDLERSLVPLESAPRSLRQGFDPTVGIPKLRGFDLFCGGGNFGRGLEEGGGIQMNWANDYDDKAIHSYMANVQPAQTVVPFHGSIDDLQRLAINGNFSSAVPAIGEVDFISGGSPCPGFSRLTNDKTTAQQRKNQSLVASFGSFVDLYRPKYGLLENVPGIVHKVLNRDQDVFSQLVCAIVGLGYQTEFFFLDASSCGSCQRRSRVFLAFAAPGYRLPAKPTITHAHPPGTRSLGLGMLPTGESMAEREMPRATPFDFVSAAEATADLPAIDDAKPDTCVPFPDHRVAMGMTRTQRLRIGLIPKQPWGMNFAKAWFGVDPGNNNNSGRGILTTAERVYFATVNVDGSITEKAKSTSSSGLGKWQRSSNAYGRIVPNRLMETIVTQSNPCDGKNGRTLHWSENRIISIMDARRAQGFRDDEVVLGSVATQYKIVGNSVAREVALALGAVFREAWVESLQSSDALMYEGAAMIKTNLVVDNSSATSHAPQGGWSSRDSSLARTTRTTPTPTPVRLETTAVGGANKRRRSENLVVEIPVKRSRSISLGLM
ncbi:hypothetical protein XA68_17998 [Ophiocordyceps unilateralis]|uniref:DNA (cytosine-5-)-methyltransferase n=1 Tax=Ophiocordyceps unilateralis TaxID=268505 RepID=A0A2A9P2M5_OPHUN|nr:hypothetical protein XA68_17998 [Ophiocordyceps unilateralis]